MHWAGFGASLSHKMIGSTKVFSTGGSSHLPHAFFFKEKTE